MILERVRPDKDKRLLHKISLTNNQKTFLFEINPVYDPTFVESDVSKNSWNTHDSTKKWAKSSDANENVLKRLVLAY